MSYLLMFLMFVTALFLIVLVLIQRGKGGGLAGAFGGMGGQSAFGTKAGDLFTKITVGLATFWILLCMFAVWKLGRPSSEGPLDADLGGRATVRSGFSTPPSTDERSDGSSAPAPGQPAESEGQGSSPERSP